MSDVLRPRECGNLDTYADDILQLRGRFPSLAAAFAEFTGVGQVVDWLAARGKPSIDMVAMDEFEYDFVIELQDDDRWLVFGVS